jgi:hypothetical protein
MSVLNCPIGPRERVCADELKAATGLTTDADLVRAAAYHFAVFVLGSRAVDTDLFRLRGAGKRSAGTVRGAGTLRLL